MLYLYNSVIFEGATLVYRPDCNAEGGCHTNSLAVTAARGIAGGTIYQRGARTKSRYYHYYHLISRCIIVLWAFCVRFSPVRGVNLILDTVCKSRWCRQILSRLRADLRENPTKQWASRDALIQSAGSISNSARYQSDTNIALGPILKMYIPGQIRIFNALNSDDYSTGNAPPSGNNNKCTTPVA